MKVSVLIWRYIWHVINRCHAWNRFDLTRVRRCRCDMRARQVLAQITKRGTDLKAVASTHDTACRTHPGPPACIVCHVPEPWARLRSRPARHPIQSNLWEPGMILNNCTHTSCMVSAYGIMLCFFSVSAASSGQQAAAWLSHCAEMSSPYPCARFPPHCHCVKRHSHNRQITAGLYLLYVEVGCLLYRTRGADNSGCLIYLFIIWVD
jgi:hypothetical protein